MTTDVQIRKNHLHLPHLRRVVSCIAAGLGMKREDIEDTERAVSEVCSESMDDLQDGNLYIKLSAQEKFMTIEITDPSVIFDPNSAGGWLSGAGYPPVFERIHHLADDVELFCGQEGATVRITKYAEKLEKAAPYLTPIGTTSLQS